MTVLSEISKATDAALAYYLQRRNYGANVVSKALVRQRPRSSDYTATVFRCEVRSEAEDFNVYAKHCDSPSIVAKEFRIMRSDLMTESDAVEWISRPVKPGDVFYDIGASAELYSIRGAMTQAN